MYDVPSENIIKQYIGTLVSEEKRLKEKAAAEILVNALKSRQNSSNHIQTTSIPVSEDRSCGNNSTSNTRAFTHTLTHAVVANHITSKPISRDIEPDGIDKTRLTTEKGTYSDACTRNENGNECGPKV